MLKELGHYPWWFIKCKFLGKRIPLELVFNITSRCNLQCKHCAVRDTYQPMDVSYLELMEAFDRFYAMGTRVVWFGGGEPTLWQGTNDEGKKCGIEDLIESARRKGYFKVVLITNGIPPIETSADAVWVSIDGLEAKHDSIRGEGSFATTTKNVRESSHGNIYLNMTINPLNYQDVEGVIRMAPENGFKGVSFSFHTPFKGTEQFFLPQDKRNKVADTIIRLKREGFPVVNSISGMEKMKVIDWGPRCTYWTAAFLNPDGTIIDGCPGYYEEGVCEKCGFGMGRELSGIFNLNPTSIMEALGLVLKGEVYR